MSFNPAYIDTPEGYKAFEEWWDEYEIRVQEYHKREAIMRKAKTQGEESLTEEELKVYKQFKGKLRYNVCP